MCPSDFVGLAPDPEKCDRFFHCVVGQAIALYCAPGYEFDVERSVSRGYSIYIDSDG